MKNNYLIDDTSIFFNQLTGKSPYPYQSYVAEKIINGTNVFLCAPTGAGKTLTALLPYLYTKKQSKMFIDRLIYILPLRTLATSIYNETVEYCRNVFNVINTIEQSKKCNRDKDNIVITIQTGEEKNDPFFEGDIIFTTVDQCLSSYLNMPVSLPIKRLGNINAGAMIGSLLVFDEFHLLEPDKSMGTAVEMLNRLKFLSQFIVMTATLSNKSMKLLKEVIGGEIEIKKLTSDEIKQLPSHKYKKRVYKWVSDKINSENIIENHNKKRSIVITNTVSKAQKIYKDLREKITGTNTTILLLHSRFYPEDRKGIENRLKEFFGKEASKTNVILVTTQVVEAGIDISADNLHTELAPLNSIVQRGGRCARYEGIRGVGTVWIYELELNVKGNPNIKPYDDDIISATRSVIAKELSGDGKKLDFEDEMELLEKVHAEKEFSDIKQYENLYARRKSVHNAMDGINDNGVKELIRDIVSIIIIISNNPRSLDFNKDKWPRMLSIPRSSLYRLKQFFDEPYSFDEAVAWYPVEPNIIDDTYDNLFEWQPINSVDDFKNIFWFIVVNSKYANYTSEFGLEMGVSSKNTDENQQTKYFDRPIVQRNAISVETYRHHVEHIVLISRQMNQCYDNSIKKLSFYYNKEPNFIKKLTEIACIFHDIGKLSVEWQKSMRQWQEYKDKGKLTNEPLAHSDFNPKTDFEKKKEFPKQPPHAAEGAYTISEWLPDEIGVDFSIAVCSAITRHHGAFTSSVSKFKLIDTIPDFINIGDIFLGGINLNDDPDCLDQKSFKDRILTFSKSNDYERLWPIYVFLVRRLRLADQKSQIKEQ